MEMAKYEEQEVTIIQKNKYVPKETKRERKQRELTQERKKCGSSFKAVPRNYPKKHPHSHAFDVFMDQPNW